MADQTTVPPNGEEAGILAEGIVETIRQPLLILNGDLRVQSSNDAFCKTFRVEPAETEGRMIYELGNNQWDIPRLRELLTEILPRARPSRHSRSSMPLKGLARRSCWSAPAGYSVPAIARR
jgi:PAS domain-containing protein